MSSTSDQSSPSFIKSKPRRNKYNWDHGVRQGINVLEQILKLQKINGELFFLDGVKPQNANEFITVRMNTKYLLAFLWFYNNYVITPQLSDESKAQIELLSKKHPEISHEKLKNAGLIKQKIYKIISKENKLEEPLQIRKLDFAYFIDKISFLFGDRREKPSPKRLESEFGQEVYQIIDVNEFKRIIYYLNSKLKHNLNLVKLSKLTPNHHVERARANTQFSPNTKLPLLIQAVLRKGLRTRHTPKTDTKLLLPPRFFNTELKHIKKLYQSTVSPLGRKWLAKCYARKLIKEDITFKSPSLKKMLSTTSAFTTNVITHLFLLSDSPNKAYLEWLMDHFNIDMKKFKHIVQKLALQDNYELDEIDRSIGDWYYLENIAK